MLVDVYNLPIGPAHLLPLSDTGTLTASLASSAHKAACMFKAPKAGTINRIGVYCTGVTGTPPDYRLNLQGVSGRVPDGSIKGSGSANVVIASASWIASTLIRGTLGTPLTVAAGDDLAAVVEHDAGSCDAFNLAQVLMRYSMLGQAASPHAASSSGSWSVASGVPCIVAYYDDDTVIPGCVQLSTLANNAITSASNPLYLATTWTPRMRCQVSGCIVGLRPQTASTFNIKLFRGSTLLATAAVDPNKTWRVITAAEMGLVLLPPTYLDPGTKYYFAIEPTSATAFTTFAEMRFADLIARRASFGEIGGATSPSGTPSWSDVERVYPIIPVLSKVENGYRKRLQWGKAA